MDRRDFGSEDIVATWDLLGDSHALLVAIAVEDGISAPVPGLFLGIALGVSARTVIDQSTLVDLEELKLGLVDILAVTVARSKGGCGPTMVGAVPSIFVTTASAFVVPCEGHLGASRCFSCVRTWRSIYVGDTRAGLVILLGRRLHFKVRLHIRVVQLGTHDWLIAPALVGPPGRRLVLRVLLGSCAESRV